MYGIFTYRFTMFYHYKQPNVGKYTIHGFYGSYIISNWLARLCSATVFLHIYLVDTKKVLLLLNTLLQTYCTLPKNDIAPKNSLSQKEISSSTPPNVHTPKKANPLLKPLWIRPYFSVSNFLILCSHLLWSVNSKTSTSHEKWRFSESWLPDVPHFRLDKGIQ